MSSNFVLIALLSVWPHVADVDTCEHILDELYRLERQMLPRSTHYADSIITLVQTRAADLRTCSPEEKAWVYQPLTNAFNQKGLYHHTEYWLGQVIDAIRAHPPAYRLYGGKLYDRWGLAAMRLGRYRRAARLYAMSDSLYYERAFLEQHEGMYREHAMMLVNYAWTLRYASSPQEARCRLERGAAALYGLCASAVGCDALDSFFVAEADSLRYLLRGTNPALCTPRYEPPTSAGSSWAWINLAAALVMGAWAVRLYRRRRLQHA